MSSHTHPEFGIFFLLFENKEKTTDGMLRQHQRAGRWEVVLFDLLPLSVPWTLLPSEFCQSSGWLWLKLGILLIPV